MLRTTRSRLGLAALLMLLMLAFGALAHPVLADGLPTPLPEAISGPDAQMLVAAAEAHGLKCEQPQVGAEQWLCNVQIGRDVYYIANFYSVPTLVMQAYVSGPLPWPDGHDTFLRDMAAPFCPADQLDAIGSFVALTRDAGPEGLTLDDTACLLASDYMVEPIPVQVLTAFAKVNPTELPSPLPTALPTAPPPLATPTPSPTPTTSPSPTPVPAGTPTGSVNDGSGSTITPGAFVRAVPAPSQISSEPLIIAQSLALAGLLVLLMPFPAQLFNSTLEAHHGTVRRWFRLDRLQRAAGRLGGLWDGIVGIALFVVLSALIYALLDPSIGIDARGVATIVGLAIGIVLTTVMAAAPSLLDALRHGGQWRLRVLPAALAVGLVCVLISRLTGFLPGYLYGVILGFVFARQLSRAEQGRANGLAAALLLAVSLTAWLLLAVLGSGANGLLGTIAATALSTLLVAGLEAVVFGLLPFRFLPGEPLHATNRLFWAALLLIGAFCLFHILINPASGYLSSSASTPLFTIVVLLVSFGLLSFAFWAYFRNKPVEA